MSRTLCDCISLRPHPQSHFSWGSFACWRCGSEHRIQALCAAPGQKQWGNLGVQAFDNHVWCFQAVSVPLDESR